MVLWENSLEFCQKVKVSQIGSIVALFTSSVFLRSLLQYHKCVCYNFSTKNKTIWFQLTWPAMPPEECQGRIENVCGHLLTIYKIGCHQDTQTFAGKRSTHKETQELKETFTYKIGAVHLAMSKYWVFFTGQYFLGVSLMISHCLAWNTD